MSSDISFAVTFRGVTHELTLPNDTTLSSLQACLEELTSVPASLQKLLYKGKKVQLKESEDVSIVQAGLRDGIKVQMLGSTSEEIDGIQAVESERHRRDRIMRERALKPQVKVRSTGSSNSTIESVTYTFHRLEPLSYLPQPASAYEVLSRLANDASIRHVMQKHKFSVGLLTELAPHEQPNLLGLNVNGGQAIKLRLRTDAYDGFRSYMEVRRVLCHELAHNVWSEHDNNFKELNSQLNREILEFETSVVRGTHTLVEIGPTYESSSNMEHESHSHTLGNSTESDSQLDSVEDRRQKMLRAALSRLKKEEEELEQSCGTAGPAQTSH